MSVRNWSVSTKLIAAFSVLIAILLVQGGMIFSTVRTLNEADDTRARSLLVSNQTARVMTDVLEQMNAVRGYTLKGDPAFLKTYRENEAALRGLTAEMMATTRRDVTRQRIETIQRAVAAWQAGKLQQTIALARNPATRVEAQTIAGSKQLGTIRDAITDLSDSQKARVAELDGVASRAEAQLHMVLWIGVAAAVVVAAAMAWLLSIGIARPIVGMTTAMKRLAEGDYAVTIIGRDRGDEIGGMAQAVEVFRENGIAKEAADQAKTRADVEQRQMVETVSAHLSQLSSGDLTAAITEEFPAKYAALRTNFNDALGKLRDLIGAVSESATAIRTGSGEIAQASEDLARRTESNAASLEETAASVTQMDGRLRASATAATRTVERADQAIATVGGGRAVADQAVQAMGRVSESAKGIDSVIEGLDKIAFQTRVLAMNAAVEAGRAGDAGRGFAVVADLVSALAMRAEEEAKRARDQLTVTQTDIVTAVEAVTKVDGALANISGDVSQVHELLATMAADNQAQSAAITQISAAIGTMDQSTQQNAAMVEETSAAARNLVGEVGSLADQAGLFRITDRAGSSRTMRRPLPETLSSLVQQHG